MNTMTAPSLIGAAPAPATDSNAPQTLLDLMYDGFYALFMLKNGNAPKNDGEFAARMTQFLDEFGRVAKKRGASSEDIDASKYAFCAAVDEIILRSRFTIADRWATNPLQLTLFGDQLAGENFFNRLEALRARGSAHLEALEVFHMCLLLGFQGRYALDGRDKLDYLVARLGDEIARMRGRTRGFAPHAERPDQVVNRLQSDLSLWVLGAVFMVAGLGAYLGFRTALSNDAGTRMAQYNDLVKLPPKAAHVTITLP